MTSQQPDSSESMTTLSECMAHAEETGFTAEFSVSEKGLCVAGKERYYQPEDTHIERFYRFEGESNPDDMSILYLIRTGDGTKGTLVDAYGAYADSRINSFITEVHDIRKNKAG